MNEEEKMALFWKYNFASGIKFVDDSLTNWPPALGPRPDMADVRDWVIEHATFLEDEQTARDQVSNGRRSRTLSKLSMTPGQLEDLVELLRDELK